MRRIQQEIEAQKRADGQPVAWTGNSIDDPLYQLLVDCNKLTVDMDNEMSVIHNYIRDRYRKRFPELESLVSCCAYFVVLFILLCR